jgi:autotransporter-associated beta strand protein
VGASVTFNGNTTGNNPAQTGNRTASLDGTKTVGSILFNTDLSTFTNTISTGTGGPLVFDNGGAGVSITTMGAGTGNNTISVAMTLNEMVTATVSNTAATSAAGSLNLTGTMGGAGGFTKLGDGLATFGTGGRTYTGATVLGDVNGVLGGGRMRISSAAQPANTSSFTIYSGAQLDMIGSSSGPSSYTMGNGPLNLNGIGATSGSFAAFPGAIRNDRGLIITVTNNVVLQTNSLIHIEANVGTGNTANPTGSLTLSGTVSGPGKLTFTAPNSDIEQGFLVLNGANSYSGGTLVQGGILDLNGANATFGTGNVTVDNTGSPSSIARIQIEAGVLNAFGGSATLSLLGGGTAGVADQNFAVLNANATVGGLFLGGVAQTAGTYGSTTSGAQFQSNEFFSGNGILTVTGVPEPGTMTLAGFAGTGLALKLIRRRKKA